jgi:NAD(P)H dehydrogenase (quinone)
LVFGITDYVAKKESLHYGAVVVGEPRADHAKEACRRAGVRLAEWVGYYKDGRKELHPLDAKYQRFWELAD